LTFKPEVSNFHVCRGVQELPDSKDGIDSIELLPEAIPATLYLALVRRPPIESDWKLVDGVWERSTVVLMRDATGREVMGTERIERCSVEWVKKMGCRQNNHVKQALACSAQLFFRAAKPVMVGA
jgi:hypothetical protein